MFHDSSLVDFNREDFGLIASGWLPQSGWMTSTAARRGGSGRAPTARWCGWRGGETIGG